jgi:anti-sigma B factor antagonist
MAGIDFTITKTEHEIIIVGLDGDLIGEAIGSRLLETLNDLLFEGAKRFILDLSQVRYVNSAGIGLLITILTKIRNKDGEMVLMNPSSHFNKLLLITKLNKIFPVVDQVAEAREILLKN